MAVIRVEKTKNYTVMSNYHLQDRRLSLKAKGILSVLLSLPENWNYSIGGLVAICIEGESAVKAVLKELKKYKYLKIEKITPNNTNGGRYEYIYTVYEQPHEIQEVEIQGVENLPVEIQPIENIPLYKDTNISSTNAISEADMYALLVDIEDYELAELYREYTEWRNTTDAPLTKQGLKMLIKRCERLSEYKVSSQKAMVETALIQGWKNVFSPKQEEMKGVNEVLEEHGKILFGD